MSTSRPRSIALIAVCIAAACESAVHGTGPVDTVTVSARTVANVLTSLASSELRVGQTTRASAFPIDSLGNPLAGKAVAWSSLNPDIATVSTSGVVTAVAPGSAVIRATVESIGGAATLAVNGTSSSTPNATASVTVAIDSSALAAGHSSQATVVAKDANNVVLTGKLPAWASQNPLIATVTPAGVVTGVGAGSTQIQATIDGTVGSAPLTVTGPSVTSPTPSNGAPGGHPNEPAGFSQIAFQSFDQPNNADFGPGANQNNYSIVTDADSPEGSQNVGQLSFHPGLGGGTAPGGVYPLVNPFAMRPTSVYVSFWVKVSDPWISPVQSGANKILYIQSTENGGTNWGSIEFLAFGFDPTDQLLQPAPDLENIVGVTGMPGSALPINKVPYDASSAAPRAVWGHYEVLMALNTPGQADGTYKWWWNGRLYGDYTNRVRWTDTPGVAFQTVYWEPTYGGSFLPVPIDQSMRMKNLYISGR